MSCNKIQWTNVRMHRSSKIASIKNWFIRNNCGQVPPSTRERKRWAQFLEQGFRPSEIESIRENALCQLAIRATSVTGDEWRSLQARLMVMDHEIDRNDLSREMKDQLIEFLKAHQVSLKKFHKHLSGPDTPEIAHRIVAKLHQDNRTHNRAIAARSAWYERQIENVLSSQGIEFKTEHDIRLMDPKARCTPDLWFPDPITIYLDGKAHKINWMDAKSMVGTHQFSMQLNALKKQSKKYDIAFGPGAFVFHFGFDGGLPDHLPGVLILDYLPSDPIPECHE